MWVSQGLTGLTDLTCSVSANGDKPDGELGIVSTRDTAVVFRSDILTV